MFTDNDFNVFTIDGFQERMGALEEIIRPKLYALGHHFAPKLSVMTGQEIFAHVAKHARRTVNPPNDTWVAFSSNKRGYKMMPHFQIGLWGTHLFIWFAVIYEATMKQEIGTKLEKSAEQIKEIIPANFMWSMDHTKPEAVIHQSLEIENLIEMFKRLQTVKKAEILCGVQISREDAVQLNEDELINKIQNTFETLMPLYKM